MVLDAMELSWNAGITVQGSEPITVQDWWWTQHRQLSGIYPDLPWHQYRDACRRGQMEGSWGGAVGNLVDLDAT